MDSAEPSVKLTGSRGLQLTDGDFINTLDLWFQKKNHSYEKAHCAYCKALNHLTHHSAKTSVVRTSLPC